MPSIDNYSLDRYRLGSSGIAVKSVQRGTTRINNATSQIDVKISQVDLTKAILKFDFSSPAAYAIEGYTRGELLDSTTIRFARGSATAGNYVDINYEVIEFENVKSIQRGITKQTSGAITVTISPVDMSKSFVFASYSADDGIALIESTVGNIRAILNTSTSLLINTLSYSGMSKTIVYQVVEFE